MPLRAVAARYLASVEDGTAADGIFQILDTPAATDPPGRDPADGLRRWFPTCALTRYGWTG